MFHASRLHATEVSAQRPLDPRGRPAGHDVRLSLGAAAGAGRGRAGGGPGARAGRRPLGVDAGAGVGAERVHRVLSEWVCSCIRLKIQPNKESVWK